SATRATAGATPEAARAWSYPGAVSPSARITLRVAPGAAATGVVGRHGDAWKVRVAQPAESGRANAAVVKLLAEALSVGRGEVVAGHASRDKMVAVAGLARDDIDAALTRARARSAKP